MCQATDLFARLLSITHSPRNTPADLLPLEAFLRSRLYPSRTISTVLDLADRGGDVGEAEGIEDEDREALGRLVPARVLVDLVCAQ